MNKRTTELANAYTAINDTLVPINIITGTKIKKGAKNANN